MRLPQRKVYVYGATVIMVAVVTACVYFMDLHLMSTNIFKTFIVQSTRRQEKHINPHEMTIVTMYLNIGRFQKGAGGGDFTPDTYKNWMKTWGWLTNRVIAFFDSDETLNLFRQIRSSQPENMTVLIKVNRSDLPAFNDLETVKRIFSSHGYPKHPPNTVVAEYSLAMNAKHDVIKMAITRNVVHTNYMAWLDIGLFRNLVDSSLTPKDGRFTLEVPDNFNSSCVSMSEVTPWKHFSKNTAWDYIKNNQVWVSGAFLMGTKEAVWSFSESYKQMVARLLEQNMASTDQQVIGAMYSPDYVHNQKVGLKPYTCSSGQFGLGGSDLEYFCLGYLCKDSAENRRTNRMSTMSSSQMTT